jgi:hypothetical protein
MDNLYEKIERLAWEQMKAFAGGGTAATYRQGETEIPIAVVQTTPTPDGFAFEDFRLYKTSRIFEIEKASLSGIVPKENDTIIIDETPYTVKKSQSGPCYIDVGAYGITIQIHTLIYR